MFVVPLTVNMFCGLDSVSSYSTYVGPAGEVICDVAGSIALAETIGPARQAGERADHHRDTPQGIR